MATPSEELVSPLEVELGSVLETVQTYQKLKQLEQQTIRDESKATETKRKTEIAKWDDLLKDYCPVEQTKIGQIMDA